MGTQHDHSDDPEHVRRTRRPWQGEDMVTLLAIARHSTERGPCACACACRAPTADGSEWIGNEAPRDADPGVVQA
jgi:hypothetical protein